ncbi:carboxypeptidase regulatory-like domain-containing protein [Alistipes sp.]|uniref:carboxypeptidase regulatory-like domain-containing protein n=1 Tax=Alistipes sp. TaxID=1872444 RepID=UPI003AEFD496
MPLFRYLFLTALLAGGGRGFAQQDGTASLRGRVADSLLGAGLSGAVVSATDGRDTLLVTSDRTGAFRFRGLRLQGRYTVSARFLGYRSASQRVLLASPDCDMGVLALAPDSTLIDEVVVRSRVPVMTLRGDTAQYNAAAVKVMEGSETIELVRKLPGLEVLDDGNVSYRNKLVEETRVDNRLLFGTDPRDALQNLPAADVQRILVFTERQLGRKKRERTVMNIQTKSKLDWQINAFALASYGADTEKNIDRRFQDRYGVGGEANFFSETHQFKSNLLFDNIGRLANRPDFLLKNRISGAYNRNLAASAEYAYNVGQWRVFGNYGYKQTYDRSRTILERLYTSSGADDARVYRDTTGLENDLRSHHAQVYLTYGRDLADTPPLSFTSSFSYDREKKDAERFTHARDERPGAVLSVDPLSDRGSRGWSFKADGQAMYSPREGRSQTNLDWDITVGESRAGGIRVDSLGTTVRKTDLRLTGSGRTRDMRAGLLQLVQLGEMWNLRAGYQVHYQYERSLSVAWDNYREQVDSSQTSIFTTDYLTQSAEAGFDYRGAMEFHASVKYQHARQNRDERIPVADRSRNGFTNWMPEAGFQFRAFDFRLMGMLNYTTAVQLPSVEMTRSYVDGANPLLLSGGNPSLKQSLTHHLETDWNWRSNGGFSVLLLVRAQLTSDAIVARERSFAEAAVLPEYGGYRVLKGAVLRTWANAPGSRLATVWLTFDFPLRNILRVRFSPINYETSRSPQYLGDRLVYTNSRVPQVQLHLRSLFSRKIDLSLLTRSSFGMVRNSEDYRSDYFRQEVRGEVKWDLLSRCFLRANYSYDFYHNRDRAIADQRVHLLNAAFGVYFGRQKCCSASIAGYDLLQSNRRFSSALLTDYVQNKWSELPGRYVTVNFSYKFFKRGRTAGAR